MAIHAGAAEVRDGDYYGPTINRAALRSLAGGEIAALRLAPPKRRHHLPHPFVDLGQVTLRGADVLNSCTGCGTVRASTDCAACWPPLATPALATSSIFVAPDLLTRMQRGGSPHGRRRWSPLAGEAHREVHTCSSARRSVATSQACRS